MRVTKNSDKKEWLVVGIAFPVNDDEKVCLITLQSTNILQDPSVKHDSTLTGEHVGRSEVSEC